MPGVLVRRAVGGSEDDLEGDVTDVSPDIPVYLSLGAGVQSSTLALMAAAGEVAPMPRAAIFADTKSEPGSVYEWLAHLKTLIPFPVHDVTAGSLEESARTPHVSAKGKTYLRTAIPFHTLSANGKAGRMSHRTCTRDYKLTPIFRKVRQEVGDKAIRAWRKTYQAEWDAWRAWEKRQKEIRVAKLKHHRPPDPIPFPREAWDRMQTNALACQWIGMSWDELGRVKPSRIPWIVSRWPLVEMRLTRAKCLEWMEQHGHPRPPRSACWFCPFRSNVEWRALKENDPIYFDKAIAFDHEARKLWKTQDNMKSMVFIHHHLVPLDEANLGSDGDGGQLMLWNDECAGVCGV